MRKYETSNAWVLGHRYPYLKSVRERWGALADKYARQYELDSELLYSVISHESGGNPQAVSPAGAQGLMQITPHTAKGLGLTDPFDPEKNLEAGARYLRSLIDRYDGNIAYALAAYNWGPGNLKKHNYRLIENSETQKYLYNILGIRQLDEYDPKVGRARDALFDYDLIFGLMEWASKAETPLQDDLPENPLDGRHPIEKAFPQLKIEPWSIRFDGTHWSAIYVDPITRIPKGELHLYHDREGRVWSKQMELGLLPRESIVPTLKPVDRYNLALGFEYQPPRTSAPRARVGLIDPITPPLFEPIDGIALF